MVKLLYDVFIKIYLAAIHLAAPFNTKAKQWIVGRKSLLKQLETSIIPNKPLIWMHCASLGEFEQGRPVLEHLKIENPSYKILLTFFSPSGYEVRKGYEGADYIYYLPMDSKANAAAFLEITKPDLILFVKYEFWFYYLIEAQKREIPTLLISGIFREGQPFFKWYGGLHKTMLSTFNHLFVQNENSAKLLLNIGYQNKMSIGGDTRFDRVIEIALTAKDLPFIERFISGTNVVVAGSTWTEDDKELDHFANTNAEVKFIIAPHNITSHRLKECKYLYQNAILYSEFIKDQSAEGFNTLIIDNIGMLSTLYKYATVCYVGGAFGDDGVHNVLEAAVYGKPVLFGPVYEKYAEAIDLVECGGAYSVETGLELEQKLKQLLQKGDDYTKSSSAARNFVLENTGATAKVIDYIQENRLLTK